MILIDRWLTGSQNFVVGKTLYDTYGADTALKALFAKGESAFAKQKLYEALASIAACGKRPVIKSTVTTILPMPKGTDGVLVGIEKEWQPKYQRMNLLRHKLDEYGADNNIEARIACKALCDEIMQLEQECEAIWKKRDHYEEHGQLPEIKEEQLEIPKDAVQLATLISTLKRNIQRNKKKVLDEPTNPKYPALVKKYQSQLDQVLNATKN
jgi:hypothetical protein